VPAHDEDKNLKDAVLGAFLGRSGDDSLASRIMSWKWRWLTGNEVEFLGRWAGNYTENRERRSLFSRKRPEKDLKAFLEELNHDKLTELREFWGLLPVPP
jgi:hypothetical protein